MRKIASEQEAKALREIGAELASSVPGWFGTAARFDAAQTPELRVHTHSFIARYTVHRGAETFHVLVKIPHKTHRLDLQAALKNKTLLPSALAEYNQLLETWQAFEQINDPDCTAIQPLGFLESWSAVITLETQARPLRTLLVTPQVGFSQATATGQFTEYLHKASRWLRHYHEKIGDRRVDPVSKELMAARLEKITDDVAVHIGDRYNAPANLSALRAKIQEASGPEPIARLHGDFHSSNILVTPSGKVCVLDPRVDSHHQSVYKDLATLLIDLHLKPIPMLTGGIFTEKFIEQSRRIVTESYFEPGEYQPALLNFYCACETIFKWSMDERDFSQRLKMRLVAPLARPVLNNYMHGLIRRYLQA
jgi:hypothetical protein